MTTEYEEELYEALAASYEDVNEVTRKDLLEQAEAVQEAVEASMYYPVAHGEAKELMDMIEQYDD